jgi:ribosomal protein L7/L12
MIPLWLWTAFAGLAVGMVYAWLAKKKVASAPRKLTPAAVEEITALVADSKSVRAIKLLRLNTGQSLLDAKNRIDDWRPDEERDAAR